MVFRSRHNRCLRFQVHYARNVGHYIFQFRRYLGGTAGEHGDNIFSIIQRGLSPPRLRYHRNFRRDLIGNEGVGKNPSLRRKINFFQNYNILIQLGFAFNNLISDIS